MHLWFSFPHRKLLLSFQPHVPWSIYKVKGRIPWNSKNWAELCLDHIMQSLTSWSLLVMYLPSQWGNPTEIHLVFITTIPLPFEKCESKMEAGHMFFQIFFVISPKGLLQQNGLWGLLCLNIILCFWERHSTLLYLIKYLLINSSISMQCLKEHLSPFLFWGYNSIPVGAQREW